MNRLCPRLPALLRLMVPLAAMVYCSSLAAAPIDTVRDCATTAPAGATGIQDLGMACPGLEEALQALGLDGQLYDGWRKNLSRDALRDVVELARSYGGPAPARRPDVGALAGVLKALAAEQDAQTRSWWDIFKAWLGKWLGSHDGALSWLDRWLDGLGHSLTLWNIILYSLTAMVVLAAGWIVTHEMQAAGLFAKKAGRAAVASLDPAAAVAVSADGAEPVAQAERLSALLRQLVSRLTQTGRLKMERSLTHRELVARAQLDESRRAAFAAVAGTAESALYGAQRVAPERLSSVLRQGQTLLADLPDSTDAR